MHATVRTSALRFPTAMMVLLLALGSGCAFERTVLDDSVVDTFGQADQDLDFWDEVATRPAVTNNDAIHGLLLLGEGEDPARRYEERVEIARTNGWLLGGESPPANESATVGMISLAVFDILEIEGGWFINVFGPTPRHCAREIVYLGIIPDRTENQSLTGLEFADLVRRAAEEKRLAGVDGAGG